MTERKDGGMNDFDSELSEILEVFCLPFHRSDKEVVELYASIKKLLKDSLPKEKDSPKGNGCECNAYYSGECGCDASWEDNDKWNAYRSELIKKWGSG